MILWLLARHSIGRASPGRSPPTARVSLIPHGAPHGVHKRRRDDRDETLWVTHNVIQENVMRGGLHAMGRDANNRARRVTTREVRNIDGDVKLNRALWLLSQRMAELKAAA